MTDNVLGAIFILLMSFLLILFGGEPDLMDGLVYWITDAGICLESK